MGLIAVLAQKTIQSLMIEKPGGIRVQLKHQQRVAAPANS
jgi:hypothetical protein